VEYKRVNDLPLLDLNGTGTGPVTSAIRWPLLRYFQEHLFLG